MKEQLLIASLSLATILTLGACNSNETTDEAVTEALPSGSTISYNIHDISINVPSSWESDTSSEDLYYFYPVSTSDSENVVSMFMVSFDTINESEILSESTNTLFESFNDGIEESGISIDSSEDINSLPYPCEHITGSQKIDEVLYSIDAYTIIYGSDCYLLMMGEDSSKNLDYSQELNEILLSISFNATDQLEDATEYKESTEDYEENTEYESSLDDTESPKEKSPIQIVDDIIREARTDAQNASDKDLQKALTFIIENIDTCYDSDDDMKDMIYYGYLLNYKYGDGTIEGDLGFDAAQAAKDVYRGVNDVDSTFVKENIRQAKEGLELLKK